MSKRTYEEYIKNGCHPVGYNEPCQSYYFGQVSVDWLLDQIDQLKQQLAEKEQKFLEFQEDSIRNEQIYVRELAEKDKEIETDRDTWKRACELACEKLADIYSHCEYELFGDNVDEYRKYCEENGNPLQNIRYCETKYFYQQAKKEGEQK